MLDSGNIANGTIKDSHPTICIPEDRELIQTHGVFANENPLDFIFPVLLLQITLLFTISHTIYFIFKPLRQPKFVCNILAGIILGPSGLGRNKKLLDTLFPETEMLVFNTFAAFGSAYYAFIMAVKMDIGTLLLRSTSNKYVWIISLSSYVIPYFLIQLASPLIASQIEGNLKLMPVAALWNALATTHFPIVTHVMEELELITTELGRLVMSCAMIIELLAHGYSILVVTATRGSSLVALETILMSIAPVLFAICVIKPFIRRVIRNTPEGKDVSESYLVTIMIGALGIVFIGDSAWGIFLPGAILAGAIIPEGPPLGSILVERYELLVMEFFLPFFFMQVGYLTDIYSINHMKALWFTLILLLVWYCSKILATLVAATYLNVRVQNGVLLGIILNFKGIFELLIYPRWLELKIIDAQCYSILVLSSVCFIILCSPAIRQLYNPQIRLFTFYSSNQYPRTLQTTPKAVELRVLTCIYTEANVHNIINLLDAFYPNTSSPIYAYVIHSRELVGAATPSLTPLKRHSKKSTLYSSDQILRAFLNHSKNSNGLISVEPFIMIAPYKTMHNIICNFADDKQVPFTVIPFYRNNEKFDSKNPLRGFVRKLFEHSPCTVGVLVHMGGEDASAHFAQRKKLKSVAVVFRGGVDDREGLALTIRMSQSENMNITLFVLTSNKFREMASDVDLEQHLDNKLVEEFGGTNMNKETNVIQEVEVNNGLQMMELVQSMQCNFDLVIVGKSPRIEIDENILEWMENPELGVVGDMFASSINSEDFDISVLVMQHYRVHDLSKSSSQKSDIYSTWI